MTSLLERTEAGLPGPRVATGKGAVALFLAMMLFTTALFLLHSPAHPRPGSDSTLLAIQSQGCVEDGWCNTDNVHLSRVGPPHGALWHYFREIALVFDMGPDAILKALCVLNAFAVALLVGLLSLCSGWRWAALAGLAWLWFWDAPADLWNPSLIPWTASLMLVATVLAIRVKGLHLAFVAGLVTGLATQTHLLLVLFGLAIVPVMARAFPGPRRFAAYATWLISFLAAMQIWAPTMFLGLQTGEISWTWLWVVGGLVPAGMAAVDWLLHSRWVPAWVVAERGLVGLSAFFWMVAGLLAFFFGPAEARYNAYYYIPSELGAMIWLAMAGHVMQLKVRLWWAARKQTSPGESTPLQAATLRPWPRTHQIWAVATLVMALALGANAAVDYATRPPMLGLMAEETAASLARARVKGLADFEQIRESMVMGPDLSSYWWNAIAVWPSIPKVAPVESKAWVDEGQRGLRRRILLVPQLQELAPGWERIPRVDGEYPVIARTERAVVNRGKAWTCVSRPDDGTCECRPFHDGTCDIADSDSLWPLRWMCFYRQRVFQSSQGKADLFSVWPIWPSDAPVPLDSKPEAGEEASLVASLDKASYERLPGKSWFVPPLDVDGRCPGYALPNEAFETPLQKPWSMATKREDARPDQPLVTWHPVRDNYCAEKLILTQQDVPMPIPEGPSAFVAPLFHLPEGGLGPNLPEEFPHGLPQSCLASIDQWRPPEPLEKTYPNTRPSRIWISPKYVLPAALLAIALLLIISVFLAKWLLLPAKSSD